MSTINLPALSQFKKESIEYDVGYDTYNDTAYVYKIRDVSFVIRHEEEKYGHDTWGWTVEVCTPYHTYYVGSKILSLQMGYRLLEKFVLGKRLATKEDRKLLEQVKRKSKDAAKAYFDYDSKNRITEYRTSEYIGCKKCGSANTAQEALKQYAEKSKPWRDWDPRTLEAIDITNVTI